MMVLTECLTRSSLLNPSDYLDWPSVASESMEPEMSRTQMMATGLRLASSLGGVILMLARKLPAWKDARVSKVRSSLFMMFGDSY